MGVMAVVSLFLPWIKIGGAHFKGGKATQKASQELGLSGDVDWALMFSPGKREWSVAMTDPFYGISGKDISKALKQKTARGRTAVFFVETVFLLSPSQFPNSNVLIYFGPSLLIISVAFALLIRKRAMWLMSGFAVLAVAFILRYCLLASSFQRSVESIFPGMGIWLLFYALFLSGLILVIGSFLVQSTAKKKVGSSEKVKNPAGKGKKK